MKKEYAYMVKVKGIDGRARGIMYHLGTYNVGIFGISERGLAFRALRTYKTISGAERYLLQDFSSVEKTDPEAMSAVEILRGTEQFIKEGAYWKGVL